MVARCGLLLGELALLEASFVRKRDLKDVKSKGVKEALIRWERHEEAARPFHSVCVLLLALPKP